MQTRLRGKITTNTITVSYTHLDVYKRQALGSAYVTGSGYLTQEDCRRALVTAPITDLGQIEIGYICNPARAMSELALEYIEWLKKITV